MCRKVTFSSAAKQHDGLTSRNYTLQALIVSFLQCEAEFTEFSVFEVVQFDAHCARALVEDMDDLLARMHNQAIVYNTCNDFQVRDYVQLLPRGGGLQLRLSFIDYTTYIERLFLVVQSAADRLALGEALPAKRICRDVETGRVFELESTTAEICNM